MDNPERKRRNPQPGRVSQDNRPARATKPSRTPHPIRPSAGPRRRGSRWRPIAAVLAIVLFLIVAWPVGVLWWASSQISHVDALSDTAATPGVTYLLAGSDERDDQSIVEGRRSDTIMLLHKASNGQASLVSLPRDAYVDIPGNGKSKLNASYAWGGEKLLVQTVEQLSGLHVDHYIEIGMGGFKDLVDAVGGVELCLDYEVDDPNSGLYWPGGCNIADGNRALAFSRMRYQDPRGDIGRGDRQRQVVSAVLDKALSSDTFWSPQRQVDLSGAGARSVQTDPDTSAFDLARAALAVRRAVNDNLSGAPPISTLALQTRAGIAVELDSDRIDGFFEKMGNGTLTPDDFNQAE
ncbi:MAG: LCP family protein [Actinomycetaceae bacterium]|nr:LCP family protein [Actinomycetaceae bacterium]